MKIFLSACTLHMSLYTPWNTSIIPVAKSSSGIILQEASAKLCSMLTWFHDKPLSLSPGMPVCMVPFWGAVTGNHVENISGHEDNTPDCAAEETASILLCSSIHSTPFQSSCPVPVQSSGHEDDSNGGDGWQLQLLLLEFRVVKRYAAMATCTHALKPRGCCSCFGMSTVVTAVCCLGSNHLEVCL